MSVKKPVSLLLALIMVLTVFAAAPFTVANADAQKYKIECQFDGMSVYRISDGETETVTEATPGEHLYISMTDVKSVGEGRFFSNEYYVNGRSTRISYYEYPPEFDMPAEDVMVTVGTKEKSPVKMKIWDGQPHRIDSSISAFLLHHDEYIDLYYGPNGSYQLLDFGYSGVFDAKLYSEPDLDEEGKETGSYTDYIQLLEGFDAPGSVVINWDSIYSRYSPITLYLSESAYHPLAITKPSYVTIKNEAYGFLYEDYTEAESGDILTFNVDFEHPDFPEDEYFTGDIYVDGVKLVDGSGDSGSEIIMPDHPVTIEIATAKRHPLYLNLSDGKPHEYPAGLNPYFYWDLTGRFGDIHGYTEFQWDFNSSGQYDVRFYTEYVKDDNGKILEEHCFAQLVEGADAFGVTTFERGFRNSEFTTINFVQVICGDTDGDGIMTVMDATSIQRHLVDLPVTGFSAFCADADCNNEVDIIDATVIQRRIAGYDT